ncbi:hemerythrin domain-containing protein [Paraburkholderia sp. LEh10]|uniref:hemerythrin domain-containing protein n=1 Tax=Paraburkholderia sp. LEh10 TaxID=2821353 RepID=UPI001AE62586|nr:hemerythrin domain-containing protein [Paraburkholderia sp. LEh10]MBP0588543.1 hemerythrin domain-containing protein [Paraburkholderia sp. LEh10]
MSEDANKELAAEAAIANTAADAIGLLKADHRAVENLFAAFQQAGDTDLEVKGALAQRACEELTVHTMIEEEILYPIAHHALDRRDEIDVDEAYVEHYLVKTLIAKFDSLKPGDRGFDATFKVMSEMVRHHIEEEESALFPELRESKLDLVRLGELIAAQKAELVKKLEAAGSKLVGDGSLTFRPSRELT